MSTPVAYRIRTERCASRCFEPRDARELHALVLANREHLARWLEWAREEPIGLHERVELVRAFRRRFDADEEYAYAVTERPGDRLIGSVALRPVPDEPRAYTVGYWFAREAGGRGLATETVGALVRCAFEVRRATRVEIHCDASNEKSRALAARLGFRLDAELRERGHAPGEARAVHSLFAAEYPGSPTARIAAAAYDALDDVLFDSAPPRRAGFR